MVNFEVNCKPFSCRMSFRACAMNLSMAHNALNMLEAGVSVFLIDDIEVDRLIFCSRCPLFPPDKVEAANQHLRSALQKVMEIIDRWDEYGRDPELSEIRKKRRAKRYRERHKKILALDKQIRRLEKEMEDIWYGNDEVEDDS